MSSRPKSILCAAFAVILVTIATGLAVRAADGDSATPEPTVLPSQTSPSAETSSSPVSSTPAGAATADSDVLEPKTESSKSTKESAKEAVKEAAGQPKSGAEAHISMLLSGSKTTLRFELENQSAQTWMAYAPFSNGTVLAVMNPQGQVRLYGQWKPEVEPFAMEPGAKKHWDVDICDYVRFPDKGLYTIWFETGKTPSSGGTVALNSWYEGGKTESNRIQFVKD